METHEQVTGYFKVFTDDGVLSQMRDGHEHVEPARTRGAPAIVQWLYPYTESTRDREHVRASLQADIVRERLGGGAEITFGAVHDVPHAHAFRVSLPESK